MKLRSTLSLVGDVRQRILLPKLQPLFSPHSTDLFFSQGWGEEPILSQLPGAVELEHPPSEIHINWHSEDIVQEGVIQSGSFNSPFPHSLLAPECREAHIRLILPKGYNVKTPLCLIFAMTADEGFEYRTQAYANKLLKKGVATVLLENPYYGVRRPKDQTSFVSKTVQDILAMCSAAVVEGRALLQYFYNKGHRQLCSAGVSQGGMLAFIVGATMPFPTAIAASLAPHSPEVIFTQGALRSLVDWQALGTPLDKNAIDHFADLFALGNVYKLPKPMCLRAVYIQAAKKDIIVPHSSAIQVHQAWPGSSMEWLPGTHITSLALRSAHFTRLIRNSLKSLRMETDSPRNAT